MNKRKILHREYTIEYERTADRTEIQIGLPDNGEVLVYGADEDLSLHNICVELLADIATGDSYYEQYDGEVMDGFVNALKQTIEEER